MKTIYDQMQDGTRKFVKIEAIYIKRYTDDIIVSTSLLWETSKHNPDYLNKPIAKLTNNLELPKYILFEVVNNSLIELLTGLPIVSHDDANSSVGVFYTTEEIIHKVRTLEEFKNIFNEYYKFGISQFKEIYLDFFNTAIINKQKRDSKIKILKRKI